MRRARLTRAVVGAAAGLLCLASARPVAAALGGRLSSVEADQARLGGTLRSTALPGYVVQEIQTPAGTAVREFASPSGVVFGIAWDGPFLPDLRQLMARYFDEYVQAMKERPRSRGPVVLRLPDLVFESSGHPRHFHGRAYVPGLMPQSVRAQEIR